MGKWPFSVGTKIEPVPVHLVLYGVRDLRFGDPKSNTETGTLNFVP